MNSKCTICQNLNDADKLKLIQAVRDDGYTSTQASKLVSELAGRPISKWPVLRHFDVCLDMPMSKIRQNNIHNEKINTPPAQDISTRGGGSIDLGPDGGQLVSPALSETDAAKISDMSQILEMFDIDTNVFRVKDDTVRISKWQQKAADGDDPEFLTAYKFQFERIPSDSIEELDLPALFNEIKFTPQHGELRRAYPGDEIGTTTVITNFGDAQLGKVDTRGGLTEFLGRMKTITHGIRAHYEEAFQPQTSYDTTTPHKAIIIVDNGDIIEGFSNTSAQLRTNDLSLMKQVEIAATLIAQQINLALEYTDDVTYVAMPSNHARWASGGNKNLLGHVNDDWGITIANLMKLQFGDLIKVEVPDDYQETLVITEPGGLKIGFSHGDKFGSMKATDWLAKQNLGAMPLYEAELFIHGHHHNYHVYQAGRTVLNKARWVVCTPTLDNGSSWWTRSGGVGDSDPGMLLMTIKNGQYSPNCHHLLSIGQNGELL